MTSRQSVLQIFVALLILCAVIFVLMDNLTLRKRTSTDSESYRTSVHDAVIKCQNASRLPLVDGISETAAAREKLSGISNIVGGWRAFSQASGFDCVMIHNTMTLQARQLRKDAIAKGLIPEHALNRASSEEEPLVLMDQPESDVRYR